MLCDLYLTKTIFNLKTFSAGGVAQWPCMFSLPEVFGSILGTTKENREKVMTGRRL